MTVVNDCLIHFYFLWSYFLLLLASLLIEFRSKAFMLCCSFDSSWLLRYDGLKVALSLIEEVKSLNTLLRSRFPCFNSSSSKPVGTCLLLRLPEIEYRISILFLAYSSSSVLNRINLLLESHLSLLLLYLFLTLNRDVGIILPIIIMFLYCIE